VAGNKPFASSSRRVPYSGHITWRLDWQLPLKENVMYQEQIDELIRLESACGLAIKRLQHLAKVAEMVPEADLSRTDVVLGTYGTTLCLIVTGPQSCDSDMAFGTLAGIVNPKPGASRKIGNLDMGYQPYRTLVVISPALSDEEMMVA
jgi:hypothetical protein